MSRREPGEDPQPQEEVPQAQSHRDQDERRVARRAQIQRSLDVDGFDGFNAFNDGAQEENPPENGEASFRFRLRSFQRELEPFLCLLQQTRQNTLAR